MPPKKASKPSQPSKGTESKKAKASAPQATESDKNALSHMFKKIETKDSYLKECKHCNQRIKSCLYNDHINTKCPNRKSIESPPKQSAATSLNDDDEIIFISSSIQKFSSGNSRTKIKTEENESNLESSPKCSSDTLHLSSQLVKEEAIVYANKEDEEEKKVELCDIKPQTEIKSESNESLSKRMRKSDSVLVEEDIKNENQLDDDDMLLLSHCVSFEKNPHEFSFKTQTLLNTEEEKSASQTARNPDFDYNLNNFENAIKYVLNEETFSHLLSDYDREIIQKFARLSNHSKKLYVRLFQRKYKWLNQEKITYDRIATNLEPNLNELLAHSFLIDENSIDSCEEMIYLLKLPQLKELAKVCHVVNLSQTVKVRSEFIRLILQHFRTQKSLKFNLKAATPSKEAQANNSNNKPHFMIQCHKILGKVYKLEKNQRDVFVRLLMLFALTSTLHVDPNQKDNNAQQNFLQILLVNIGKVKYMSYEIKLTINIFEDRNALLRYQESIDYMCDLLNYVESKDYDEAYEKFSDKIGEFKKIILNPDLNQIDVNLPIYLRMFTSGSMYCKFISLFAFEILQKLKKYAETNEIFEFLIFKQSIYLPSYRSKWYERLALIYETHLKNPFKAYEILCMGLKDHQYVRKAGRLTLFVRLKKMSETKKYMKIKDLKDGLKAACIRENYAFTEAPTHEIEGTILQSDYIPGRKNIFIQNFEPNTEQHFDDESSQSREASSSVSSNILVKGAYNLSVEQVALTHYIKNLAFTNGKHAETSVITTLYGLLFWNIIFDDSVANVFVDKFQSSPLDMQTDHFYQNRKCLIDSKLDLLRNSPIDFICELYTEAWNNYNGLECSLVSWSLFTDLEEFLSLARCFNGIQLASLCEYISKNYRYCRSGGPDLIVWSSLTNKCRFVEVKGPGDRLSFKQMVWLDFFIQNGIDCVVCYVKGQQNSKRLRH